MKFTLFLAILTLPAAFGFASQVSCPHLSGDYTFEFNPEQEPVDLKVAQAGCHQVTMSGSGVPTFPSVIEVDTKEHEVTIGPMTVDYYAKWTMLEPEQTPGLLVHSVLKIPGHEKLSGDQAFYLDAQGNFIVRFPSDAAGVAISRTYSRKP